MLKSICALHYHNIKSNSLENKILYHLILLMGVGKEDINLFRPLRVLISPRNAMEQQEVSEPCFQGPKLQAQTHWLEN